MNISCGSSYWDLHLQTLIAYIISCDGDVLHLISLGNALIKSELLRDLN